MTRLVGKSLAVWLVILLVAIANGALREAILIPALGQTPGLLLSGSLLSAMILGVTYFSLPWLKTKQRGALIAIGVGWLVLTLIFEFSFGFIQGHSLARILEAYTFRDGNIWPLVLLIVACAPLLASRLRSRR